MPFKSAAQRRWMWANKPALAREWTEKYGSGTKRKSGGKKRKKAR